MTIKQYLKDHRTHGTVQITEIIPGDHPIVHLKETWFHPQGGGQKADRGTIGTAHVLHVAHNGGDVEHFVDAVDGLLVGNEYPFAIDEAWRRLNMAYHTGGHLIAGVVESAFPRLAAVSGHQWPGEARVEFEGAVPPEGVSVERLNNLVAQALEQNLAVQVVGDPFTSRAIKVGDYKEIPCGGTHVQYLGDISKLHVTAAKVKSGRLRVSYEAAPRM